MKRFIGKLCLTALGMVFLAACNEDSLNPDDDIKNEYTIGWINKFGLMDQSQTWNMAMAVPADVNPAAYAPDATVYIYSANPTNGGKLIGKTSSQTTLTLDVMQGSESVFVQALDSRGCCYENSYYPITDGKVSVKGAPLSRAAGDITLGSTKVFAAGVGGHGETREAYNAENPYTLTEAKTLNDKKYLWKKSLTKRHIVVSEYYSYDEYDAVFEDIYGNEYPVENVQGSWTPPTGFLYYGGFTADEIAAIGYGVSNVCNQRLLRAESPAVTYQRINGIETSRDRSAKIKDLAPLFGTGGYFEEQRDPTCLRNWKDQFQPNVTFVVNGPLTLDYMYGATGHTNVFGYYYWQDGEDPLEATRYILIDDARPQSNISINEASNYISDGMSLASTMMNGKPTESKDMLIGTSYKVPYFDKEGNPTYNFPNGTHVAFFLLVNGYSASGDQSSVEDTWLGNTNLSVQSHNYDMYRYFTGYDRNGSFDESQGEIDAISFRYGNQYYLGFEDRGGDKDMNDIVFFVNGNATPAEPVIIINAPTDGSEEWILACEDLGSTDDYDFNDVVFSVSHVAGETTATITPLAAGGVLRAEIWYDGSPIAGNADDSEIHYLLTGQRGSYPYPMLNTTSGETPASATPIEIAVPADFSIVSNLSKFSIVVAGRGNSYQINAPSPGEAPQILCLPGDWQWPSERTDITLAYPSFKSWTGNASNTGWLFSYDSNRIIHRKPK